MKYLILILLLFLSSCSSFTVTKLTDQNREEVEGLRFFMPKAYLLVAEKDLLVDGLKTVKDDGKNKVSTTQKMAVARKELRCSVIYLPDPQQEYAIETLSSKTSQSIRFENGWQLTGFNEVEDTSLSSETLHFLSGTEGLVPGIYEIRQENGSTLLKKVEIIL